MLALLLAVFLFILGIGLLFFIERDSQAGLHLQRSQKALVMAQTGLLFARHTEMEYGPSAIAVGAPHKIYDLDNVGHEQFEIWKDGDAHASIHCAGIIKNSQGAVVARRELAAPTMLGTTRVINYMHLNTWDVDL